MAFKDIAKSGALGLGTALIAKNPDMLRGLGLVGNIAANKLEDREEKKRREAEMAAAGMVPAQGGAAPMPMKKGGKVSSASKRADGIAIKGKTRGRMV
jgi:hypothetical protein